MLSIPVFQSDFERYYQNVLIEAHGIIFDLAFIGILILWLQKNGERQQRIRRYLDEIDDFRFWKSEESAYRAMGNIKRLNRDKIYKIDLSHSYLQNTNLNYVNLSGSNLNSANLSHCYLISSNFSNARLNQANMEGCHMNNTNLSDAFLSGGNFMNASLIKGNLYNANCIMANFENTFLMEADMRNSNLLGTNLKNANLYKTDLRGVKGLTMEQIEMVKTMHKAKVDPPLAAKIRAAFPSIELEEEANFDKEEIPAAKNDPKSASPSAKKPYVHEKATMGNKPTVA
ncbi:MAG: pentapeptide repeat-containing protein [Cytophagales bacterium]|nr:pentapeptide repeat-containing protein [Cytophagales bacterium]